MQTCVGMTSYSNGILDAIDCQIHGYIHLHPIPINDYGNDHYHCQIKPSMKDDYEQDKDWWTEIHNDWLDLIPSRSGHRLLDVGAGTGAFIENARLAGWDVVGIEPDHNMAKDNSSILWGEYQDYVGNGYDVVSAHWVVEHLANPIHFLDWMQNRLTDNGYLLITIPNDFSTIQYEAMPAIDRPYYWLDRYHINYWNGPRFVQFLSVRGWSVVEAYGSWQPEKHLLDGMNYLEDPNLGRKLHGERMRHDLETRAEYRRSKYKLMGALGLGRDLTFVAKKK